VQLGQVTYHGIKSILLVCVGGLMKLIILSIDAFWIERE